MSSGGNGRALKQIWRSYGPRGEAETLYCGVGPRLSSFADAGGTCRTEGLWNHRRAALGTGRRWALPPRFFSTFHAQRIRIAGTTGQSHEDGGATWRPYKKGVRAIFSPRNDPSSASAGKGAQYAAQSRGCSCNHWVYTAAMIAARTGRIANGVPSDLALPWPSIRTIDCAWIVPLGRMLPMHDRRQTARLRTRKRLRSGSR